MQMSITAPDIPTRMAYTRPVIRLFNLTQ